MALDFEDTESFHIYSGMFCCVRGVNPNGHALVVECIRPLSFTTEVEEKMEKPIQNTSELAMKAMPLLKNQFPYGNGY